MKRLIWLIAALSATLCALAPAVAQKTMPVPSYDSETDYRASNVPPVTRSARIDFTADFFYRPALSISFEQPIARELAIGIQLMGGLTPSNSYSSVDGKRFGLFTRENLFVRWYFGRGFRVHKGYTLRGNSGFFTEIALGHYFDTERVQKEDDGNRIFGYYLSPEYRTAYNNSLTFHIAPGYTIVTRSHIYFGTKLGLGYMLSLPQEGKKSVLSLYPAFEIKLGYAF